MSLIEWLTASGCGRSAFAARIGVKPQFLAQMLAGRRPVPATLVMAIERATGGAVRCWDCRPDDWHLIWPDVADDALAPRLAERA